MVATPSPGQLVTVRQRRYVVTEVKRSELPGDPQAGPGMREPQHLVALSSVEDDGLGEEAEVVWEIEPGRRVFERSSLPDPSRGFDDPNRLDAFLHAIRWGAIASADRLSLNAPFRSGAALEDYQLDPVARALQMPRVNLLIADDVGLGKTIEAGLVVQELLLRHRARSVLVICPAGLQIQWREQMRDKFGLDFRIVDSELLRELRRTRGLHVNPWSHFPRLITSLDFIKRERPLRLFRELLPREGESTFPRRFDLLILDEAHNVAPAGRGMYALDSLRTDTIRVLAPHFEHKLFLSATPHNGYPESFTALLELLDDQRFQRGVRPDPRQLAAVMVRRLKTEIVDWSGKPKFPTRKLAALEVPYADADRKAHRVLADYAGSRREGAEGDERFAGELVLKLLKKRLFSSPAAFATTLEKHARSLDVARKTKRRNVRKPSLRILERMAQGLDEDPVDDAERDAEEAEAVAESSRLFRPLSPAEAEMLAELRRYAESAAGRGDAKSRVLVDWLKATLKTDNKWNDERVIVLTEYRTTQKWLLDVLAQAGLMDKGRVMTLYGGMAPEDREAIKAAFQASARLSDVRILLATDAASEGIDLQNHCHRLIHYEIPWNPNRMEQRNGRIDRYRQHQTVCVHHFVGVGWKEHPGGPGDLEGDLEFLYRAAVKVENIREDLGKVGPVIEQQVQEAMLGKRHSLDTERTERSAGEARAVLKVERKIREELERLRARLKESQAILDISPEHVQRVVEVGLALAGQPPLEDARVEGLWPSQNAERNRCPVFRLPPLAGSWALCADGLRHPHTGEVRPIVFDEPLARDRDDVVLVHLHHRLAQMCLGLLRAEVWAPEGRERALHRVAARVVPDKMIDGPVVIAEARLLMLGADSARLHEELMVTGGFIREGRFARMKPAEAEAVLEASTPKRVANAVLSRLAELWPRHRDALIQSIDVRADERKSSLMKALSIRAEREASDVEAILNELARSIEAEFRNEPQQLSLFTSPEREQFQRNREALASRVKAIPDEIARERHAIFARYANPTARVFPAALVYVIPESLARASQGKP
jgi:superfamily II DNA or RNA helicase